MKGGYTDLLRNFINNGNNINITVKRITIPKSN